MLSESLRSEMIALDSQAGAPDLKVIAAAMPEARADPSCLKTNTIQPGSSLKTYLQNSFEQVSLRTGSA
jgi:hypothetical protein